MNLIYYHPNDIIFYLLLVLFIGTGNQSWNSNFNLQHHFLVILIVIVHLHSVIVKIIDFTDSNLRHLNLIIIVIVYDVAYNIKFKIINP